MKKDIQRGRGSARLADGAKLFDPGDDSHVTKSTPIMVKRKELQDDPRYCTEAAPDTNKAREQRTTRLRRDKDVKPI